MEDQDQEVVRSVMSGFRGRKLTWCGFDEDEEKFYLFFDGMAALVVSEIVVAQNGRDLARRILVEQLDSARHLIELNDLAEASSDKESSDGGDGASKEAATETPGT